MLRMIRVIKGDVVFQWKYGFYFLYIITTIVYLSGLSLLHGNVKEIVNHILIYSDPAAMGLFFMGAIVLLEKSQRVLNSIAVSPIKVEEYILGKVVSIGGISVIVAVILLTVNKSAGMTVLSVVLSMIGIFFASCIFSMAGILVGCRIESLTQYVVGTIPAEIIGFLPAIAYRLGFEKDNCLMLLHPGCAAIYLLNGELNFAYVALVSLVAWSIVFFCIARISVKKMFRRVGGVKL